MIVSALLGRARAIPADAWARHQVAWRDRYGGPTTLVTADGGAFVLSGHAAELELAHVRDHRFRVDLTAAVGFQLASSDGHEGAIFMKSFLKGHSFGARAEAFLDADDDITAIVDRAADAYEARQQLAKKIGFEDDEFGEAAVLVPVFREILPLASGRLLANGDATGFASMEDGFDEWIHSEDVESGSDEPSLRGLFHCGFVFYAFETRLLLALRQSQRLEYARARLSN
jgi:hypothetical protein